MDFTITLTESEYLSLQYVSDDPYEWIKNAACNRARIATDEICKIYIDHKLNNNQPITVVGKDEMVFAAYEEGLVKTVLQQNEEELLKINAQQGN